MATGFLGMRGTGDWATDQRPLAWRKEILRLFPNGRAPLTAIMGQTKGERVTDPQFHWWTKSLPGQAGAITNIYTDLAMAVAYVANGTAGDDLYVKMAAATIAEIRVGHQVLLRDASDLTVDVNAKVIDRSSNGASSYAKVRLLEDDDNSSSGDLSDADRIMVVGNINSEGAAMPDAITYDPTKWYNYTQIFRTPLDITRTARLTSLRTGDAYTEAKREILELHSIEMEKAFLFGIPTEGTGDNGKKERSTLGLIPAIKGGYTGHGGDAGTTSDYPSESGWSGQTWLQGGEDWLDTQIGTMMAYGNREKVAFCGSGALTQINKLVKNGGDHTFTPATKAYGIQVTEWRTVHGVINIIEHPLFSYETTMTNTMVIYEPENFKWRYITDTTFHDDPDKKNSGWTRRDGTKEEYLTEGGIEYHLPIGWGYLTGFGTANTA